MCMYLVRVDKPVNWLHSLAVMVDAPVVLCNCGVDYFSMVLCYTCTVCILFYFFLLSVTVAKSS